MGGLTLKIYDSTFLPPPLSLIISSIPVVKCNIIDTPFIFKKLRYLPNVSRIHLEIMIEM